MDINIPLTLRVWMAMVAGTIQTIVVISYSTPVFLALVIPLAILYYFIQVSALLFKYVIPSPYISDNR